MDLGSLAMRSSHKTLLFNGAVVLGISLTFLALFALADKFLIAGLWSLAESVRDLEKEVKTNQRLAEEVRRSRENWHLLNQLVTDLIDQQCDLREAVARWRAAGFEFHKSFFVGRMCHQDATEEERIIIHLIFLVGEQLKQQPKEYAQVLARLQQEQAR
jgi:cell division protein FtsB